MRPPKPPLFLARAPYRRRRLRAAARLLPIIALFLLVLPLLWTPTAEMKLTANDVIYFFMVWLFLIALAAAFAPGLRGGDARDEDED